MKAADCHKKNNRCVKQPYSCLIRAGIESFHYFPCSLYSAAKSYEQATLICKELGHFEDIADLAERACVMYQQHGSPDSGAMCLEKAAKMIEQKYPDKAINLYKRGVDVVLVRTKVTFFLYTLKLCYIDK